jgi:hypothetical protein
MTCFPTVSGNRARAEPSDRGSFQRLTAEQIIGMLREAEVRPAQGKKLGERCRSLGVSAQS